MRFFVKRGPRRSRLNRLNTLLACRAIIHREPDAVNWALVAAILF